jgi:hypothetical protein
MGISLMQEQIIHKIKWCVGELGLKETEEDSMEKYIIKKHYGIVATPQYKNKDQKGDCQGYDLIQNHYKMAALLILI